jgi:hypothetical protein
MLESREGERRAMLRPSLLLLAAAWRDEAQEEERFYSKITTKKD